MLDKNDGGNDLLLGEFHFRTPTNSIIDPKSSLPLSTLPPTNHGSVENGYNYQDEVSEINKL